MIDLKKLEALLDSIESEQHYLDAPNNIVLSKQWPRRGVYAPVADPALEQKMDKYDIFRQGDYKNVSSTPEFPIWGKPVADNSASYIFGGQRRSSPAGNTAPLSGFSGWSTMPLSGVDTDGLTKEFPYEKLKKKVKNLIDVKPEKLTNPNPAPPQLPRAPDYVGTLIGWRGWDVNDDCGLVSLGSTNLWEPKRITRARCNRHYSHAAPHRDCACGFWSFKDQRQMTNVLRDYVGDVKVIGTVEIWGRVIECKNGYRSEYAYPKELWLLGDGLESLSWTYGVPVRKL